MTNKPPKTKITVQHSEREFAADMPARKGMGFLMFFGLFFGGVPLLIIVATILSSIFGNAQETSPWGIVGIVAFLSVFVMIGSAVFYWGIKLRYTSYKIKARDGSVEVTKRFFKKETSQKIVSGNVHGVGLYSFSSTNGKPDYNLLVKGRDGNDIKLASSHREEELRWLASETLTSLSQQGGLPTEEEIEELYFTSENGQEEKVSHFPKQGVKLILLNDEEFEIEKNGSTVSKSMIFGGLFGMVFSSVFIWIGFGEAHGELIFGIVGILIALVAFSIFITGIFKIGTSEKYTFKTDRIIKEKLRGSMSKSKTTHQKSSFNKLTVKSSGESNNQSRYSVKLEGSNAKLKLFSWVPLDLSDVIKHRINNWLKPPSKPTTPASNLGYGSAISTESSQTDSVKIAPTPLPHEVAIYPSNTSISDIKGGVWILRIFLGIFLTAGLGLTIFGILNFITAKESETWPSVEGRITKSSISINHGDDSTTYGADVSYQYKVNDQTHTGDKVTISEVSTSNRGRAEKIVKRYPVGKKTTVYYDPTKSTTSVLEPGITGGNWLLPGLGIVFTIVSLIILIVTEKSHSKKAKKTPKQKHSLDSIQSRYGKVK